MTIDRRAFLAGAGMLGAGVAIGGIPGGLRASPRDNLASRKTRPRASKKFLILGGTGFIGPPMVRYAVERGHEVTIFTRGRSQADLPDVERLIGDRADDLGALKGRTWDVVFDNNAQDYRWVKLTTELLRDSVEQYIFVSSISAYEGEAIGYEFADKPWSKSPIDIEAPLVSKPADFVDGQEASYGLTKALSEALVGVAFPGRSTVVRPGYIVGPGDPTDRFTYWPVRLDRGGARCSPLRGRGS